MVRKNYWLDENTTPENGVASSVFGLGETIKTVFAVFGWTTILTIGVVMGTAFALFILMELLA